MVVFLVLCCGVGPLEEGTGQGDSLERWRYEGTFNWSNEHERGSERGSMLSNGPGSGEVTLQLEAEAGGHAYFKAFGCGVELEASSSEAYRADGATCQWDAWLGLRYMQVEGIRFTTFEWDRSAGTVGYLATIERLLPDGTTVERCERAELSMQRLQ